MLHCMLRVLMPKGCSTGGVSGGRAAGALLGAQLARARQVPGCMSLIGLDPDLRGSDKIAAWIACMAPHIQKCRCLAFHG